MRRSTVENCLRTIEKSLISDHRTIARTNKKMNKKNVPKNQHFITAEMCITQNKTLLSTIFICGSVSVSFSPPYEIVWRFGCDFLFDGFLPRLPTNH